MVQIIFCSIYNFQDIVVWLKQSCLSSNPTWFWTWEKQKCLKTPSSASEKVLRVPLNTSAEVLNSFLVWTQRLSYHHSQVKQIINKLATCAGMGSNKQGVLDSTGPEMEVWKLYIEWRNQTSLFTILNVVKISTIETCHCHFSESMREREIEEGGEGEKERERKGEYDWFRKLNMNTKTVWIFVHKCANLFSSCSAITFTQNASMYTWS